LQSMSRPDVARLKEDIRPRAVIDLRTPRELTKQREISLLGEVGARYHNVPFRPDSSDYLKHETELFRDATDLAELYLYRIRPPDEDIIHDYTLSAPFKPELRDRWRNDPAAPPEVKEVPDFQWEASAESMTRFLALLRREYGSVAGYLKAQGADNALPQRLEEALLV